LDFVPRSPLNSVQIPAKQNSGLRSSSANQTTSFSWSPDPARARTQRSCSPAQSSFRASSDTDLGQGRGRSPINEAIFSQTISYRLDFVGFSDFPWDTKPQIPVVIASETRSERPELTADRSTARQQQIPLHSSSVHAPICTSTGLFVLISHENWCSGLL